MSIDNRMQSHGVRPTAVRNLILSVLDNATHPISALDIETSLDTVDRSSITRALSLFVEKGLIHIIDDGSSSAKYEVCRAPRIHTQETMQVFLPMKTCTFISVAQAAARPTASPRPFPPLRFPPALSRNSKLHHHRHLPRLPPTVTIFERFTQKIRTDPRSRFFPGSAHIV